MSNYSLRQRSKAIGVPLFFRRRTFQGGIHLPARDELTAGRPIEDLPPPAVLWVPIPQASDAGAAGGVVVEVGQSVAAGDVIWRAAEPAGLDVHAPLAGCVEAVGRVDTARHTELPAIQIIACGPAVADRDGTARGGEAMDPAGEGRAIAAEEPLLPESITLLADVADRAGLDDCRRPATGLGQQLREAAGQRITDIIINALPPEPMVTGPTQVASEASDAILEGAGWLRTLLRARRTWVAVDAADRRLVGRFRRAVAGKAVRLAPLVNKYPQAAPILLCYAITGRETPLAQPGAAVVRPTAVGVLVVEAVALAGLWAALRSGQPSVERVVTVTGPAAARPGHYRVPIGTSLGDVVRHVGLSRPLACLVDGGPMTGVTVPALDVVVTRETSALLLLDREALRMPTPAPCVRCGWCQEDCPVGLDPQALLHLLETERWGQASRLHPEACIGCGLCSYVCPSELPLAAGVAKINQHLMSGQR